MTCYTLNLNNPIEKISKTCSLNTLFSIYLCKFNNLNNLNTNGGAIYLSSTGNSTISKNIFFSCNSNNGGSIYLININFCENNFNCFDNCFATNWGQAFCSTTNNIHSFYENSIQYCSKNGDKGRSSVYIYGGNQIFKNGNLSKCWISISASYDSIIFYYAISIFSIFNNIIHNKLTIAINLAQSQSGYMNYSNIVNTTKVYDIYGLIYDNENFGSFYFNNCYFLQNIQISFSMNSGRLYLFTCFFSNNSFILPNGFLNINNLLTYNLKFNYICKNINSHQKFFYFPKFLFLIFLF